jgi:alanyl-tRNA synthetase
VIYFFEGKSLLLLRSRDYSRALYNIAEDELFMEKLGLNVLRERFLSFFESKEHLRHQSYPLVPLNDPGLLLINSGMAPLKPYFKGDEEPPRKRMTTCQKCIRTPDIENVGKTARHGTFFEMLGNFSFGDYFKKEATAWAWEFITEDLKIPADKLWISIYLEDDEAFDIWTKDVGIPAEKIVRMGKKDNFWEIGTGPCGPCSEIYFDRGPENGCGSPDCKVGCDCDRYVEFWNLVFTQFNRDDEGNYSRLAKPNIDTGMGLERLACIMQGVNNLFEVDTVTNILSTVCKIAKVQYGKDYKTDVSVRVITDHIRSTTMMVCDGVLPSNEGRGYVLRRLLRRAARHGKLLGIDRRFLCELAEVVINESKEAYPELAQKIEYIKKVIGIEEAKFESTIDQGLVILNQFIEETKEQSLNVLAGDKVFKLHDTFGFPLDLTREICEENLLEVDEDGFKTEMAEQKRKAREAMKNKDAAGWDENIYAKFDKDLKTKFTGYDKLIDNSVACLIVKDGESIDYIQQGDDAVIVLSVSPFYAESGGQAGDVGILESQTGTFKVTSCKKSVDGKYLHEGMVSQGTIDKGSAIIAKVDKATRMSTARNHTTTHLIQKALKNILGDHVSQSGSSVDSERLRFDFTHFSAMTSEELSRVEKEVNEKILEAISVNVSEMPIDEARKLGAMALFGEKYGSTVRVVKIGDYSLELCGGTHLVNTSEAGLVKIQGESGVAAGVRRIEALTGEAAISYYQEQESLLKSVAGVLKSSVVDSVKKADSLNIQIKELEKELEILRNKLISSSMDDILSKVKVIKGINVLSARFDHLDGDGLRNTGDTLKNKLNTGVVILASGKDGKVSLVVMATKDVVEKGIHCGNIIREASKACGGGGGGRPDMAQAGGKDVSKIDEALKVAVAVIEKE